MSFRKQCRYGIRAGFTLIELLVVIGVIGILAAALIVIINPAEQLARGRDATRKAKISQLGKAIEAYAIDNAAYPAESTTWMNTLSARGYLKTALPAVSGNKACNVTLSHNGFCYDQAAASHVFTYVESSAEASKCGAVGGASSTVYYAYDTSAGKACIKCGDSYLGACTAIQ